METDRRMYDLRYQADKIINDDEPEDLGPIRTLAQYEEKEVEWLVKGYLPKGQITLICGTGGTGKTSVWTSLIASLSTGSRTLFDGTDPVLPRMPITTMFFSAEDAVEQVIKKKMRNELADQSKILTMSLSDPRFDQIKFGSPFLENLVRSYRPKLVVFDPLQNFIDPKIKMSDRNAMRQNMRSLIEWGQRYDTTFLIVMHTNKLSNAWGRARMADSADLWDIARCVWMVGDADDKGLKYLSHEKSNYGKTGRTMLFRNDHGTPTFEAWSDKKDKDFVAEATKIKNAVQKGQTISECCNAILSELGEHPDGMLTKELDSLLNEVLGFKAWLIKESKKNLKEGGQIHYFKSGMGGDWFIKKTR